MTWESLIRVRTILTENLYPGVSRICVVNPVSRVEAGDSVT